MARLNMKGFYKKLENLSVVRKRFRRGKDWLQEPEEGGENKWSTTRALELNSQVLKATIQYMTKRKLSIFQLEPQAWDTTSFLRKAVFKCPSFLPPCCCALSLATGEEAVQGDELQTRECEATMARCLVSSPNGELRVQAAEGQQAPGPGAQGILGLSLCVCGGGRAARGGCGCVCVCGLGFKMGLGFIGLNGFIGFRVYKGLGFIIGLVCVCVWVWLSGCLGVGVGVGVRAGVCVGANARSV